MIERTGQIKQKESDRNFKCRWDGHERQKSKVEIHRYMYAVGERQ